MKKSLLAIVATVAVAFSFNVEAQAADPQTFGVATEGQSFTLSFTYPLPLLPIRILNNGTTFRDFTVTSISSVSTNGNLGTFSFVMTPLVRGIYNFTSVAIDPVLGLSPPSNICTVTNQHVAPGQLKRILP